MPRAKRTPSEANAFQGRYFALLHRLGYQVHAEVPWPFEEASGRIRLSRIDLVAERDGLVIAYELDTVKPRKKNVAKLKTFPCDEAWVVCRKSGVIERVK